MNKEIAQRILQKTTDDYKKISKEFIQTRIKPWPIFNRFKRYVKDNDRVLDVGCGTGRLVEIFKDTSVEYSGFDSSDETISFAKKKYCFPPPPTSPSKLEGEERWGRQNFIVWDITNIPWPFENESFDIVFMVAVLHHIPSEALRQEVLREISRVLKPDGKLIMINWNLRSIWSIKKFWPEILRIIFPRKDLDRGDFFAPWKLKSGEQVHRFYHSFSLRKIRREVEEVKFDILENYYTINGERSNFLFGKNILTVAKKEGGKMAKEKKNLVIFGIQGSGKGTQAKLLAKDLGIPHISTGDIFREERRNNTERGKLIRSLIDAGNLVPDRITNEIVNDRLNQSDCENGAILDGYPRNLAQAKELERIWRGGVSEAILIDISDDVAIERAIYRRNCPKCRKIYHLKSSPPLEEGKCDDCGVGLVWRDDDKKEAIKKRLKIYHEQTEPLIDYYRKKGTLIVIDGTGAISEVYKRIRSAIENS